MSAVHRAYVRLSRMLGWLPQKLLLAVLTVWGRLRDRVRRCVLGWRWAMHQGPRR